MVRALDQVTSINVSMETEQMSHSCLFWETLWQLTYGGRRAYIGRGIGIGILVSIVLDIGMGAYVPLGMAITMQVEG